MFIYVCITAKCTDLPHCINCTNPNTCVECEDNYRSVLGQCQRKYTTDYIT